MSTSYRYVKVDCVTNYRYVKVDCVTSYRYVKFDCVTSYSYVKVNCVTAKLMQSFSRNEIQGTSQTQHASRSYFYDKCLSNI